MIYEKKKHCDRFDPGLGHVGGVVPADAHDRPSDPAVLQQRFRDPHPRQLPVRQVPGDGVFLRTSAEPFLEGAGGLV